MIDTLLQATSLAGHLGDIAPLSAGDINAGVNIPQVDPEAPPGAEKFLKIVSWVFWGVIVVCLLGFFVSIGMLVYKALQGDKFGGWVLLIICALGVALAGSAQLILAFFL